MTKLERAWKGYALEERRRANRASRALVNLRGQLVDISSTITSADPFTKFDEDELEPIEAMIIEIDAALSAKPL